MLDEMPGEKTYVVNLGEFGDVVSIKCQITVKRQLSTVEKTRLRSLVGGLSAFINAKPQPIVAPNSLAGFLGTPSRNET